MKKISGYEEIKQYVKCLELLLEDYSICNYQKKLISYGYNVVFQVYDQETKRKYAARLSDGSKFDYQNILSEIKIINCLYPYFKKRICKVVKSSSGKFVQNINTLEEVNIYGCLFEWIEYPFMLSDITEKDVFEIGKTIAELHNNFDNSCNNVSGLYRNDWSAIGICKRIIKLGILDKFTEEEQLKNTIEYVEKTLERIPKSNNYGLIHGDIYYKNLFRSGNDIGIIDFDLCSFGFYFEDLMIFDWPDGYDTEKMISILYDGYQSIRKINIGYSEVKHVMRIVYYLRSIVFLEVKSKKTMPVNQIVFLENEFIRQITKLSCEVKESENRKEI